MWQRLKQLLTPTVSDADVQQRIAAMQAQTPVPVFWLFGKTQSGKSSIVKYLTGADAAEIGTGFQPCTKFSRQYQFPTTELPLLTFLDTRGLDEPGYTPTEDIARFNDQAHVVVVTVKVLDHAQENLRTHLRTLRAAKPSRPIVLVPTCLHEAYSQTQHPQPYPFAADTTPAFIVDDLARSLAAQKDYFAGLFDACVPIDLTKPEEGYDDPNYGGAHLKQVLLDLLPGAFRQTLVTLDQTTRELKDLHAKRALPYILAYSGVAATAGAFPIPFVDLLMLPAIQSKMVHHLATLYGQPLSGKRFAELAATLGIGLLARQAARELTKLIPIVGSVASAALAGASTYALGQAFCYYYSAVCQGQVPNPADIKKFYEQQLTYAETLWKRT
jgi:uncharacterized protein (DUF697 family)